MNLLMADELADDSDDEKHLEKAEKSAKRKAAAKRRLPGSSRPYSNQKPQLLSHQASGDRAHHAALVPLGANHWSCPGVANRPPGREIGPCFACGQVGHLRSHCRNTPVSGNRIWYLQECSEEIVSCIDEVHPQECSKKSVSCIAEVSIGCVHAESMSVSTLIDSVDEVEYVRVCVNEASDFREITLEHSAQLVVKAKLKEHIAFWMEELTVPESVLNVIESGYVLLMKALPSPFIRKNQPSAELHADFVQSSVDDILASGCAKRVDRAPHVCSPLLVVENVAGKKRLVINLRYLRYLNRYLRKQSCKYEDLRTAMLYFNAGDYMFSFDPKSGYHHIDIAEVHHKF